MELFLEGNDVWVAGLWKRRRATHPILLYLKPALKQREKILLPYPWPQDFCTERQSANSAWPITNGSCPVNDGSRWSRHSGWHFPTLSHPLPPSPALSHPLPPSPNPLPILSQPSPDGSRGFTHKISLVTVCNRWLTAGGRVVPAGLGRLLEGRPQERQKPLTTDSALRSQST